MSWNEMFTQRKQKEMTQKAISDSKKESDSKKTADSYQYTMYKSSSNSWERARSQQQRDAFAWKVGVFVMTIISIVGIYAIWWAANL